MSDASGPHLERPSTPGRVSSFMEANPFWQQVAASVVSSLIAAYVIAWVVSSIALAVQVGQGEDRDAYDLVTWSILFVLLGAAMSSATLLAYLLVDAPLEPFGAWRGRAVARAATNMVGVYFILLTILGLEITVLIGGLLVLGLYALVLRGILGSGRGRSGRTARVLGVATRHYRLVLALGVLLALAEAALVGMSLAVTYSTITT